MTASPGKPRRAIDIAAAEAAGVFGRKLHTAMRLWVDRRLDKGTPYDAQTFETLARMRTWTPADVILDIGANDGRSAKRFTRYLGAPQILSCEPVSSIYPTLCERTASLDNVTCYQQGFGAEPGQAEIYVNSIAAMSSLYRQWGETDTAETIDITTVDAFVERHDIETIQLLKIDVEGHDLEVLKGAGQTLREGRVELIMVEAGVNAPGRTAPAVHDFQKLLQPLGYQLYGLYNQAREHFEGGLTDAGPILAYCDALFVRWGAPRD